MVETEDIGEAERAKLNARYGRRFAAGETLFREGEPATHAFLLQEGRVRLIKRVRSADRSLMVIRPGELFGESALLDSAARSSTAVALTDGLALALDRETSRSLLSNHPTIAVRVMEQLIVRVRDAEDQIEILMLRDGQYKVVSSLLKLAHRIEPQPVEGGGVELNVSPVELASRVGLDVESVKRTVQRLREQGYVRIVGEKIDIPDLDAMRRLYTLLGTKDELKGEVGA